MLRINKDDTTARLIVTVTDINPVTTGSTLEVTSYYTYVTSVFNLPVDDSIYPERFNSFTLPTTTFSALTLGTYSYTIKDASSAVTETGLLKVVNWNQSIVDGSITGDYNPVIANEYVYITPAASANDYIIND